ncbi:hypothetical protein DSLASN_03320 [Desulfoluna limicola]|uniref:Uncharacterized protein n=1 Tax=Desulfoluna limicola TaxID=2810562 RepID=A0ABM7PB25_9BACT|nr:hypothetical protein DSLASN_03320 [Desulfoluna limicola]
MLSPVTTPGVPGGPHPDLFNFIDLDLFRLDRSDYNEVILPKPFLVITIVKGSWGALTGAGAFFRVSDQDGCVLYFRRQLFMRLPCGLS